MVFFKIVVLKSFIIGFIFSQEVPIEYKIADSVKFSYDLEIIGTIIHLWIKLDMLQLVKIQQLTYPM